MKKELQELQEQIKRKQSQCRGVIVGYFGWLAMMVAFGLWVLVLADIDIDNDKDMEFVFIFIFLFIIGYIIMSLLFCIRLTALQNELKLLMQQYKKMKNILLVENQPGTTFQMQPDFPSFCPCCGNRLTDTNIVYCESCGRKIR